MKAKNESLFAFTALEREVMRAGREVADRYHGKLIDVFGDDTLAADVARLQVARRVRKRFQATSQEISNAIEECLTP